MMRFYLSLLIFFFFSKTLSVAQEEKLIKKADDFFLNKNFHSALDLYHQAKDKNPKNPYVYLKIAQCHLLGKEKTKSLSFASLALRLNNKPSSEVLFTLAQAFHINHQMDSAKFYYIQSDLSNQNKKLIAKKINECEFGKKYLENPLEVKITNAGSQVNSEFQDYLPYITADFSKLYFTSRRIGSNGGKIDTDGKFFEDIYVSNNKGGAWDKAQNLGSPLNTPIHDACVGLSEDGQTMFIYKGTNGGDLYLSKLKGDKWSNPEALPINTEFFESTASLSPDERTLFFVRKIMNGSRDIYSCSKTLNGNWSKPKSLNINTEYDEDCPFIHPDGKTLYFCSKGHSSMGGYDVFKSTKTTSGNWSKPENIGYPINTAGDDVYFVLSANGQQALYSSDKEGGLGQQDIYSIRMPIKTDAPQLALLKGSVIDAETNSPILAEITITDNDTKEVVSKTQSNEQTGAYLIALPSGRNYGISIEKKDKVFFSENIYLTPQDGYKEITKEIQLSSAQVGKKVVLRNIFFDTG
ncbi:MAG: hypothetical protein EAZ07_05920, partial [Cytophagales bacterium]